LRWVSVLGCGAFKPRFLVTHVFVGQDILRVVYPAARVELFGSSLNGFGTIDSDLDLFVKVCGRLGGAENKPFFFFSASSELKRAPPLPCLAARSTGTNRGDVS
jgi:predicted nucleotidyltransferase